MSLEKDKNRNMIMQPTLPDLNALTRRTSPRQHKPSLKAKGSEDKVVQRMFGLATKANTCRIEKRSPIMIFVIHLQNMQSLFDDSINESHFYVYNDVASTNDVYILKEMLQLRDIGPFVKAMIKEITDHEERDHWMLMKRLEMPKGAKTILSIWAFKIKRLPDGTVTKHKARLNAHGVMQRWGIDYWETYTPVVNWIRMRLLLVLSIVHGLETKAIDFVLAFPQAKLERDIFMELPYGFRHGNKGEYVLKLKKNLYGLCDALYDWF